MKVLSKKNIFEVSAGTANQTINFTTDINTLTCGLMLSQFIAGKTNAIASWALAKTTLSASMAWGLAGTIASIPLFTTAGLVLSQHPEYLDELYSRVDYYTGIKF